MKIVRFDHNYYSDEHVFDILKIVKIFEDMQLSINQADAHIAWLCYSEKLGVSWAPMTDADEIIFYRVLAYCTITDYDGY